MSKDLLDGIIQGVASAVVDRFFGPDAAPDPASAPPAPPIEVREAPRVVTSFARMPQRFTCACGCAYEVGVDAVPLADGGTTDVLARLVAARMGERLGQNMVIENRAGAGGTVGSTVVAQAQPDGYTLLFSNVASQGVGPSLYRNLAYNAVTDFTHIGVIAEIPSVLIVNVDRPIRNLDEFIEASLKAGLAVGAKRSDA
jgi:hypothetical protein